MTLVPDRNGDLWVGTLAGGLNRFDPATGTFTHYQGEPGKAQGLPSNSVTSVLRDRAGTLWVGTWGGGLARLNPDTGEVTHYDHDNGLPSDAVFDILEDDQGLLWLSTSNGLSRFDPRSETFRNYDEQDGLPGNVFESAVAFQSPTARCSLVRPMACSPSIPIRFTTSSPRRRSLSPTCSWPTSPFRSAKVPCCGKPSTKPPR